MVLEGSGEKCYVRVRDKGTSLQPSHPPLALENVELGDMSTILLPVDSFKRIRLKATKTNEIVRDRGSKIYAFIDLPINPLQVNTPPSNNFAKKKTPL